MRRVIVRITMIGGGYVGLVSAACFAEFGLNVNVVETNPDRLNSLKQGMIPIYEPGLDILVSNNIKANRLQFFDKIEEAIPDCEAIFIAVGTPPRNGDGHADMTYVHQAALQIAQHLKQYAVIVTKSTVPVGTSRRIAQIIRQTNPDLEFDVASNPEFLREGDAIQDCMKPDRVIIGIEKEKKDQGKKAQAVMTRLYQPLFQQETPIVFTNLESAELAKYASNCFLAMKLSYVNELADLCEQVGGNIEDITKSMGLDPRIGRYFLQPGPGFGGSCFPKDTLALIRIAQEAGAPVRMVEAAAQANDARKTNMSGRIINLCGGSVNNKTIAILGLTFKPNTDDMRESASLPIIHRLIEEGAHIKAFDPIGNEKAQPLLPKAVQYFENIKDTALNADALIILTEWSEFRSLSPNKLKEWMKSPLVIDLRNIYDPKTMINEGIHYYSIGRPQKASLS
ncbi:UDP-glucose dehydrogenase family protein [Commensalibacter oyaizuii]|uniref:UDP-glucose 6-dehydrogenase n=1 Tax=Commensalibacter oyaizuii TaxID=3043873 RepID=A0ABT6Q2V2_9PROT|nr:UDP-glucose/GDP-mannose dehydrogenase family protein [Commensalibacter sp. TBRC 16381]MDI2091425.1 UDP-glucose/GDP-mannose dehydrogenase family protein [Commensalibacter sp. TBRC 16381]